MNEGRKCVDCAVPLNNRNNRSNRKTARCGKCYLEMKRKQRETETALHYEEV